MGFKLSRAAEADLISIYLEGVALFGPNQADAYHSGLKATFDFLGDNPKAARQRQEIDPPVRCHPHGAHLIVYIEDDDGDAFILRVRHGREDWEEDPSA